MARAKKDGHYINANIQKELYNAIVKKAARNSSWIFMINAIYKK